MTKKSLDLVRQQQIKQAEQEKKMLEGAFRYSDAVEVSGRLRDLYQDAGQEAPEQMPAASQRRGRRASISVVEKLDGRGGDGRRASPPRPSAKRGAASGRAGRRGFLVEATVDIGPLLQVIIVCNS